MYPHSHFMAAVTAAEVVVSRGILSHEQALLSGILAVLIDTDHYLYYVFHQKNFNFQKAWNYCSMQKRPEARSFIHRGPAMTVMAIFCFLLYFISLKYFWIVSIAYFSHMLLDRTPAEQSERFHRFKIGEIVVRITSFELYFDFVILLVLAFIFVLL